MPVRIVLHGECLELPESFVATHPGGAQLLHQASVLDDATPLFESYHAPTPRGVASLRAMARTYKLNAPLDADAEERIARALRAPRYTYADHGFYADVSRDVRAYFATKKSWWSFGGGSSGRPKIPLHKATPWWLLKSCAILAAMVYAAATSMMTPGGAACEDNGGWRGWAWFSSLLHGVLAGALGMSLSFVVMHDASHYAVSSSPLINEVLSAVICLPSLWSPTVWLGHHVAGHHSWTGELRHDPDVVHGRPFVRKSIGDRANAYFPQALALQRGSANDIISKAGSNSDSECKSDTGSDSSSSSSDRNSKDVLSSSSSGSSSWLSEVPLAAVVVLAAVPGMFVGQSLTYLRAMAGQKERYFGAALLRRGWVEQAAFGLCVAVWGAVLWQRPASVLGCALGANVTYFVCIAPDHDTYEAAVEDHDEPPEQKGIPLRKAAAVTAAAVSPELVAVASAEDADHADGFDAGDEANSASSTLKKQQQQQQQQQASPPKRDWGALQARRSANFATGSPLVCCAFGGINYQVEHHLFPGISHVWYPSLSPIVRAACTKHGVPYHATTWFDALRSWCRAIRHAGGGPAASP